ncbi:cobalamin-binding protein [Tautonia marina]|uniref:cobalamin-binding protein n=1 Tax=Tautonia marina TaxID=2653855 RepID=UPI0012606C7E|nr:cobalamin-binding protein [Tautonia marina]
MRIASLLPSLSELVCDLGRGEWLVGVTHECDFPSHLARLPHLTRSKIDPGGTSAEIDAVVAEQGGSLYELDRDLLEALKPDLILTQTQCDVCAVNEATVRKVAEILPSRPRVESVNPTDLAGVFEVFRRVGRLLDAEVEAETLIGRFESTAREIAQRRAGRPQPGTIMVEWTDPPFTSGHWNPELVALAGGRELLAQNGEASRRTNWETIMAAQPEVLLIAPCGFELDRVRQEVAPLTRLDGWQTLPAVRHGMVTIADGSAYFARPGPRLEASLRIAAAAIDPETCSDLAPTSGWERLVVEV